MYETLFGAGEGYGEMYDVADASSYGPGMDHTHFVVWLIVFTLAAVAILGGLKVGGFHFVVKV
jgi:hypothetical protein